MTNKNLYNYFMMFPEDMLHRDFIAILERRFQVEIGHEDKNTILNLNFLPEKQEEIDEIGRLESNVKSLTSDLGDLSVQNNEFINENNTLIVTNKELNDEIVRLNENVKVSREQVEQLMSVAENDARILEDTFKENTKLKKKIDQALEEFKKIYKENSNAVLCNSVAKILEEE